MRVKYEYKKDGSGIAINIYLEEHNDENNPEHEQLFLKNIRSIPEKLGEQGMKNVFRDSCKFITFHKIIQESRKHIRYDTVDTSEKSDTSSESHTSRPVKKQCLDKKDKHEEIKNVIKIEKEDVCAICLCPLNDTDKLYTTKCNHTFHESCSLHYAAAELSSSVRVVYCPMCRHNLF